MAFVTEQSDRVLAGAPPPRATGGGRHWLRLARELPVLPLAILIPFVVIAVFAGAIAPYDPTEPIPGAKIFEPPFWVQGANKLALLGNGLDVGVELCPELIELLIIHIALLSSAWAARGGPPCGGRDSTPA